MTEYGPDLRTPEHPGDDAVLRHVLSLRPEGWALEFGVGAGTSARIIAAKLPLIGFDSFDGLPEAWRPGFPAGKFKQAKVPEVEGATMVVGLFSETLPAFDWPDRVGLIHFDADLYSSTATALEYAGHLIQPGTLICFDEFIGYPGSEEHEQRAWDEWCLAHSAIMEVIGHGREQVAFKCIGFGENA